MRQRVTGTGRAVRAGTEAAETVSADPPVRGGGSMLEDEGHQAKDAPADHCHGQQLPGILQHGSRSDAQRSRVAA